MIFHPAIIALHTASLLIAFMILCSAYYGARIQRRWNLSSGSELQLLLERRTYLVSTMLTYAFAFELVSFFLFIYTADQLHALFVGAMCAAGSLKVNAFGYPVLMLKMVNFLLAGLWLILNHADNQAYDYALIKKKYRLLLLIAPLVLGEFFLQTRYFLLLQPNIITSCCGTLFSSGNESLSGDIASLPPVAMTILFYAGTAAVLSTGLYFLVKRRGGMLFGLLSGIHFIISAASILAFIGPYFYEMPTHHCPFCILQREYGYIGFAIYAALFGSAVTGMGAGMLAAFSGNESLAAALPVLQKKLTLASMALCFILAGIVTTRMLLTDFVLRS